MTPAMLRDLANLFASEADALMYGGPRPGEEQLSEMDRLRDIADALHERAEMEEAA